MSEARAYATRNRQGSDWFGHSDAATSPQVSTPAKVVSESPLENATPTSRSQMIKPSCNSNQWYKYDQTATPAEGNSKKNAKSPQQGSGEWFQHDTKADDTKESKPRVMTTEGESYCRRDKTGSSATWFSHEHAGESTPQNAGPRVTSKEGCGNATRMRGESENWFSHNVDKNGAPEAAHVSKGRGIQPKSSEMHQVFHMDAASK